MRVSFNTITANTLQGNKARISSRIDMTEPVLDLITNRAAKVDLEQCEIIDAKNLNTISAR